MIRALLCLLLPEPLLDKVCKGSKACKQMSTKLFTHSN